MNTLSAADYQALERQVGGFHLVPYKEVKKSFRGANRTTYEPVLAGETFATSGMAEHVDADFVNALNEIMACETESERAEYMRDYEEVFPDQDIYAMLLQTLEGMELAEARILLSDLCINAPEFHWAERTLDRIAS